MIERTRRIPWRGLCLALAIVGTAWISQAAAISASTGSSMEAVILFDLNRDRAGMGLRGLRVDPRLTTVARHRADWMAANGSMSHDTWGGLPWDAIDAVNMTAYSSGEAVGQTSATWGAEAAQYIYDLLRDSPPHWELMVSDTFNYVGIGVAYRDATGETFASLVFAEAPDSSRPVAEMTGAVRSGRTITFSWSGRDGVLQSHTAGLRDYDVQYRTDGGPWTDLWTHTLATKVVLTNRASGHAYSLRVRDRDRRNNLSSWTAPRTVLVP